VSGAGSGEASGELIRAEYLLSGARNLTEARARARDVCLEQTAEYPEDLITSSYIKERIVGRVLDLERVTRHRYRALIGFPVEVAAGELTQLVNVLFGNISLKPGIRLVGFALPASMSQTFPGPRFGREGLRELLRVRGRPLLATALKPMGLSPPELAHLARQLALGGIDLIKDDHGLADQPFCPFGERVERCGEAVREANRATGLRSIYLANVTAPADEMKLRVEIARKAGAGGLLAAPGIIGLDAMRRIAADDSIGLPLLSHPAFQGSFTVHADQGISHGTLYGMLNRLAGADGAIFPNHGGRFSFSPGQCRDLVHGTEIDMPGIKPIFPVPAGGMSLERVPELLEFYGRDAILLIGGDLHRHGSDLVESCRAFRRLVERGFSK
jgi:ribulose-bisphosphate carboxylase large chain